MENKNSGGVGKELSAQSDESPRSAQPSPRCPKCGFVMCEQFDTKRINEHAELVTPNGTYICYGCNISTGNDKVSAEAAGLKWRHHKNCAMWTVTTDGAKKDCDCAQTDSVFKGTPEAAGEGVPERVNCGTLPDHIWVHPWRELLYYSPTDQPDYVEFARVSPVTVGEAARRLAEKIIDADYVDADGELGRDAAIEEVARIVTSELSADANEAAELKQAVRDYFNIDPAENAAEWCAASNNLLRLVGLPVDHAPAPVVGDADLRERLAVLCHEQWSGWMRYQFEKCAFNENHSLLMPEPLYRRWKRQADTPYGKLSEEEKESDRKEADRFVAIFVAALKAAKSARQVKGHAAGIEQAAKTCGSQSLLANKVRALTSPAPVVGVDVALADKVNIAIRDLEKTQRADFACNLKLYVAQVEKYLRAALAASPVPSTSDVDKTEEVK